MKGTGIFILGLALPLFAMAQENREGRNFPEYPVPLSERLKSGDDLPEKVDLSKSTYFPPLVNQYGWSCNQASSIGYLLTYELSRLRNVNGDYPQNRYPPLYPWNFLNRSTYATGASYFDSWEIIKANGCPNIVDFPVDNDVSYWMSGYDKYYRAMQNRVIRNYSLSLATPEGIFLMKRYLYNHLDGSKYGGCANFQIASGGMGYTFLSDSSPDPGAPVMTTFGTVVGHAMTIVGYNDAIRFDLNHDGLFTNDTDINYDDVVDAGDMEVGAFIIYNSWGENWGRRGMAYLPYHLFGKYGYEGGIWNRSVHIIQAVKAYEPILTLRASLIHTNRSTIRIMAGIANDPTAEEPEYILEFPLFNYQGGENYLIAPGGSQQPFELGLDITPLTAYLNRGVPVKFFLIVDDSNSSSYATGTIYSFGIYNHFNGSDSVLLENLNQPIELGSRNLVSLVRPVEFNRVEVTPVPKMFAEPGEYVSVQFEATGAAEPYRWELAHDYDLAFSEQDFPREAGTVIFPVGVSDLINKVTLPFDFTFFGSVYRDIYVSNRGEILFNKTEENYPYVFDTSLVFRSYQKIVPYGQALDYYMTENCIRVDPADSAVQIFWNAIAATPEGPVPLNMACRLSRSGEIRFFFEDPDFLRFIATNYSLGISNGDGQLYKRTGSSFMREGINTVLFKPARLPEDTKLDATGWLFCGPLERNTVYDVHVRARDKYNLTGLGSVIISTFDVDSADILTNEGPNPFTGETAITFLVPEKGEVHLDIFDLSGRKVATLVDEELERSEYHVVWNGRTDRGNFLRPGIYICRLIAGGRKDSLKLAFMQ